MPNDTLESLAAEVFAAEGTNQQTPSASDPGVETHDEPGVQPPEGESLRQRAEDSRNAVEPEGEILEEGDEQSGAEIANFGDLVKELEAHGWAADDIYGLEITLNDGSEGEDPTTIPLGEIKDKLQTTIRAEKELAEQRTQLNQQVQAFMSRAREWSEASTQFSEAEQQALMGVQEVQAAYNMEPWDTMEPGDRAVKENEYQRLYAQRQQQFKDVKGKADEFRQNSMNSLRQQHNAKLIERNKDWADPAYAQKEGQAVGQYLMTEYGFTPDEIGYMVDWRLREAFIKARQWDNHQKQVANGREAVGRRKVRTMPAGKGGVRRQLSDAKANDLVNKARQTRRRDDQVAAGLAVLNSAGVRL